MSINLELKNIPVQQTVKALCETNALKLDSALPKKLFHYSKNEICKLLPDFELFADEERQRIGKPVGFWISVEDFDEDQNWFTWSVQEQFRLDHLSYKHKIKLKDSTNILFISTKEHLEQFSIQNAGEIHIHNKNPYVYWVDWKCTIKNYDGIIIAPYLTSCRILNFSTSWYYSWDCASGCIWNMKCIEECVLHQIIDVESLIKCDQTY